MSAEAAGDAEGERARRRAAGPPARDDGHPDETEPEGVPASEARRARSRRPARPGARTATAEDAGAERAARPASPAGGAAAARDHRGSGTNAIGPVA